MKILVVEDDPASRVVFKGTIEWQGHETRTANDGTEGLDMFRLFEPDLVLSDIQMPGMSGLDLLREIRKSDTETIVIIVTAFGSEEQAANALQLGANNYLKKPVRHADLLPLIEKYDNLVKVRTLRQAAAAKVTRKEFLLHFDSHLDLVPVIADQLVQEAAWRLSHKQQLRIRLGLFELLVNAIEHGNLGITGKEKADAFAEGQLTALYKRRLAEPQRTNRQVTVEYSQNLQECVWTIRDEGDGFDYNRDWNPLAGFDEQGLHGRGIFLSRMQFDEVNYMGNGNTVQAILRIQSDPSTNDRP